MAELILFVDANFGGLHTHIFENTANNGNSDFTRLALGGVGSGINGNWNDKVSSFIIVSGTWEFFKDVGYANQQGIGSPGKNAGQFGPGLYSFVADWGIDNDALSSVKCVAL